MSGRAQSLSPKKERTASRRNGPLDRPDHKRRTKTDPEGVFIKTESEDKKPWLTFEAADVEERKPPVQTTADWVKDSGPQLSEQERKEELEHFKARQRAINYLDRVGATQNVPKGYNRIDHKGKIFNPTLEVQMHEYSNHHSDMAYTCRHPNSPGTHYCIFHWNNYINHGYRYLNDDASVFYKNPDGSEYYFDESQRWFMPFPGLAPLNVKIRKIAGCM